MAEAARPPGARAQRSRESGVVRRSEVSGALWRERLLAHAVVRPTAPAVTQVLATGEHLLTTYEGLTRMALGYAQLFAATTAPGQIIPLCLVRSAESVAAVLGALLVGRAFCCVHPKLRAPQRAHVLAQLASPIALLDSAGLTAMRGLFDEGLLGRAEAALDPANSRWVRVPEAAPLSRAAQRVWDELASHGSVQLHDPSHVLPADLPAAAPASRDAVATCLFTSGSTGLPKGVLIGQAELCERACGEALLYQLTSEDVLLNVLPFSFDVGLNQLLSAFVVGAELVVLDSWLPADVLRTTAQRAVTGISAVPGIWAAFLARGLSFDTAGAHRTLRYLTVSGGDLTPAQHVRLPALAKGVAVFKTYGQTESFRSTSLLPEDYLHFPTSIGRAVEGVTLRIVRDDGTHAQVGEVGELVHSGAGTMLGYLDGSHFDKLRPLAEGLRDGATEGLDGDAYAVYTGDLGYLDEGGRAYLVGRRDDLVKIDGNRVYPAEVQRLLSALPGVGQAEVVPLRDAGAAQLAAFVVPAAGATLDSAGLRRVFAAHAPSYMVPAIWSVVDALPHTPNGKPDRPELARRARALLPTVDASSPVVTKRIVMVRDAAGGATGDVADAAVGSDAKG